MLVGKVVLLFGLMILFIPLCETYAQDQITTEQLNVEKLKGEITKLHNENEILKQQIEENNIFYIPVIREFVIPILTAVGALVGVILVWRKERRIPNTAEQEKILLELSKEWFYNHYMSVYDNTWNEIKNNEKDRFETTDITKLKEYDDFVAKKWKSLCATKQFPVELFAKKNEEEDSKKATIETLRKKLHMKKSKSDLKELTTRFETIGNSSHATYYDKMLEQLPLLIDYAINAVINPNTKLDQIDEKTREEILKKLMRLMIFTRTREDPGVVNILLDAKINQKLKDHNLTLQY